MHVCLKIMLFLTFRKNRCWIYGLQWYYFHYYFFFFSFSAVNQHLAKSKRLHLPIIAIIIEKWFSAVSARELWLLWVIIPQFLQFPLLKSYTITIERILHARVGRTCYFLHVFVYDLHKNNTAIIPYWLWLWDSNLYHTQNRTYTHTQKCRLCE